MRSGAALRAAFFAVKNRTSWWTMINTMVLWKKTRQENHVFLHHLHLRTDSFCKSIWCSCTWNNGTVLIYVGPRAKSPLSLKLQAWYRFWKLLCIQEQLIWHKKSTTPSTSFKLYRPPEGWKGFFLGWAMLFCSVPGATIMTWFPLMGRLPVISFWKGWIRCVAGATPFAD